MNDVSLNDTEMTTSSTVSEELRDRTAAALKGMETLRKVFDAKIDELSRMAPGEVKPADMITLQKELGRALATCTEQEGKYNDARRIEHGGDGLDLALARAEIGRRLDRIRDAGDPGRVSG